MHECARFYRDAVPEIVWRRLYRRLADAGRLPASFPGVDDPSLDYFLDLLARPDRHSWVLTFTSGRRRNEPAAETPPASPVATNRVAGNPVAGNPVAGNPVAGNPAANGPVAEPSGPELAGVVYVTDLEGTSGRIHFAFLPLNARRTADNLPVPVALGRFALASLLRDRYAADAPPVEHAPEDAAQAGAAAADAGPAILSPAEPPGPYILDTLIGLTPVSNRPAIKTASRCGARLIGEIPAACPDGGARRNTAGLLTCYTRDSVPEVWRHL